MTTAAHPVLGNYDVARDVAGLRIAARELFEEELAAQMAEKVGKRLAGAANEDRARAAAPVIKRTLAGGYYDWVEYLFTLEGMREAGVRFSAVELQDREVVGLQVIAGARGDFRASHPSCSSCGALLQNAFVGACWKCNHRLERKK